MMNDAEIHAIAVSIEDGEWFDDTQDMLKFAHRIIDAALEQNEWRKLALQFDAHRMQALWHLKAMTEDPQAHMAKAVGFLSALPPKPTQDTAAYLDDLAVDRFAAAMKAKMAKQRDRGYSGWHDPDVCPTRRLQKMLVEHVGKGDPVDVGNFSMMLWIRREPTAPQLAQQPHHAEAQRDRLLAAIAEAQAGASWPTGAALLAGPIVVAVEQIKKEMQS